LNVIENLENNEQILLMYLAGELPPEDHAAVEGLLAADDSLRRQCQELKSLQIAVGDGLGRLDAISMPVSADFAVRQVGRAIRQKLARPKMAPAAAASDGQTRSWWWLYPTVAAASVAIVAMIWLNRQASAPVVMQSSPSQVLPDTSPSVAEAQPSTGESDDALLLESLSTPAGSDRQESRAADDEARQQVASGDGVPQDEISQYLLSATVTGQ
jgi:hypothetical protein